MITRAAEKSHVWIIAAIIFYGAPAAQVGVSGAVIDIEKNETPFPLELQPPLIDNLDAIDSYGNPIKYSQPIETPDGRKVISAQGVQFEIPNYASGITEIKKPIDSLVPPFIGESSDEQLRPTTMTTRNTIDDNSMRSESTRLPNSQTLQRAIRKDGEKSLRGQGHGRKRKELLIGDLALDPSTADLLTQPFNPANRNNSNDVSSPSTYQSNQLPIGGSINNIPNFPTDQSSIINNSPPATIDPIAVALPNDADPDIETPQQYTLPDWLADINDPDVGPGVPYMPMDDPNTLKILSWDLLPPQKEEELASTLSIAERTSLPTTTTTTPKPTTTTTTTTTTPRPTTRTTTTTSTTTTTTTRRPPTTTTTRAPLSVSSSNSNEILALPGGNAVVLPSWLEGYDDPELSIAVPFEVPEDNDKYNHTLSNDLLPPLEPFEDLKTYKIPGQAELPTNAPSFIPSTAPSTTTTSTTPTPTTISTTIRTTTTRALPSKPTPFQFRFSSNNINPQTTSIQKTSFFPASTAPTTTTTTESPISNRISQFTLKSAAAQPSGFKPSTFAGAQVTSTSRPRPTVPPIPVLDAKFNPFLSSSAGRPQTVTFSTIPRTTTVPPTISTTPEYIFDTATIPPWLSDYKDPDLGPGVPFTLAGSGDHKVVFSELLPPSIQSEESEAQVNDGVTIQKSISSELLPLSSIHNSILSPSVPTTPQPLFTTTVQQPSKLFTPPVVLAPDDSNNATPPTQTNSLSNNNFLAATEPTTKATSKVTFNKSDQGKVISNSVKPLFGFSQGAVPSGFTVATQAPVGFNKATTTATDFTGKYTGSFGGAPGLLGGQNRPGYAIQPDGSIRDPDHTVPPRTKVTVPIAPVVTVQPKTERPAIAKRGYTGSFGGPPGVLVPYDNVKV